jgi:hypothetical protein
VNNEKKPLYELPPPEITVKRWVDQLYWTVREHFGLHEARKVQAVQDELRRLTSLGPAWD